MLRRAMLGALTALAVVACGAVPPRATLVDAQRANVELAALEQGRTLLLEKCGRCHSAPHPSKYSAAAWPAKVDEMEERSKLAPGQREAIELYLTTLAGR